MINDVLKKKFTLKENLIKLKINDEVVKRVIDFYKDAPFPNYEDDDDKSSISYKGDKNYLAEKFKKFIGFNNNVLEVGCGTGQLSLYFSIGNNNRVFALDPSLESIKLGMQFSKK